LTVGRDFASRCTVVAAAPKKVQGIDKNFPTTGSGADFAWRWLHG
jgi:hypothetical protein